MSHVWFTWQHKVTELAVPWPRLADLQSMVATTCSHDPLRIVLCHAVLCADAVLPVPAPQP
jgi:hypothetical protein